MPPTQKKAAPEKEPLLKIGALVNLVATGRTLENYEVLDVDDNFVKFRGSVLNAPQTEIVLIPIAKIEALGLRDER